MSGRHPFSNLTKDFTPERRKRIDAIKSELLAETPLRELRHTLAQANMDPTEPLRLRRHSGSRCRRQSDGRSQAPRLP